MRSKEGTPAAMRRLFVALIPPPVPMAKLLGIMAPTPHWRWQTAAQLHCTLAFLGTVDATAVATARSALRQVTSAPVPFALSGVAPLRQGDRAVAIRAGVTPLANVTALAAAVSAALRGAGLPTEDRPYLPHVTLAWLRRRSGPIDDFLARHAALASDEALIDHFVLMASITSPQGSHYTVLERYPLSG